MFEALSWEWRDEQKENPFRRGSTRPLKVTLHSASLTNLTAEQHSAIELLRELSETEHIDLLETQSEAANYIEIGPQEPGKDFIDVTVWNEGVRDIGTYIPYPEQKLTTARALAKQSNPQHPDAQAALEAVLAVSAHAALNRDLFVTESTWVYDPRERDIVRRANPRRVLDALQIIGLLLRSRDQYLYRVRKKSFFDPGRFSRHLYYWVLARHRTPNIWRYFSACIQSRNAGNSSVSRMASSILTRCMHALQARDHIGEAFYAPYDDRSSDETTYHFDYLTLLLVGALDAEARIAHRTYSVEGPSRVSFRRTDFLERLRKAGAGPLYELLTEDRAKALFTLLFTVRNTIHEASVSANGIITSGKGPSWIEIEEGAFASALWTAAESLGGAEAWGLRKLRYQKGADGPLVEPLRFVPYPYALQLVRECVALIDGVAAATDVARLFENQSLPELMDGPPEDRSFASDIRERLALLS